MTLTAWGLNGRGQLAASYFSTGPEGPVSCVLLEGATQVAGSYKGFTMALQPDGTLRALGGGVNGEMGIGQRQASYYLPVTPQVDGVIAIACAGAHTTALLSNGTVASWGGNSLGTLGNGTSGLGKEEAGSPVPILVPELTGVKQVDTSNGLVAALLADGSVRTWGCGTTGALGIGTVVPLNSLEGSTPQTVPDLDGVTALAVGGFGPSGHVLALMDDGTVIQWGDKDPCGTEENLLSPEPVPGLVNIVAVAAGPGQSFAIDAIGDVYAWGKNYLGQLFVDGAVASVSTPTVVLRKIRQVACGFQYSLALDWQGRVLGAGREDEGQLLGAGLSGVRGIVACEHHAFAIGGDACEAPIRIGKVSPGGLEVVWSASEQIKRWEITTGVLDEEPEKTVLLNPSARSYTFAATPGLTYTVKVRGGPEWARTAVAVA